MGKIVISTNMSLDGVVQDPDGQEGSARGGWFGRFGADGLGAWTELELAEVRAADALLLGRRSDKWFARRWLPREGEFADRMNGLPKYVVSQTLETPAWSNATVVKGDLVEQVSRIRAERAGDVLVFASYRLGRALIEHDLVDEVRLVVFPVVVGAGERLFGATGEAKPLQLLSTRAIGGGLVLLTYQAGRPW